LLHCCCCDKFYRCQEQHRNSSLDHTERVAAAAVKQTLIFAIYSQHLFDAAVNKKKKLSPWLI